jgi:adenosylcobinamide kinase/adenosylcobinamide-phosphate guanylyltransferase
MHFVTGGAFNGKSNWVRTYNPVITRDAYWFSAYFKDELPEHVDQFREDCIILEGIEQWIKELLQEVDAAKARQKWRLLLEQWQKWETNDKGRTVILIASDITKGIVPTKAEDREWRDVTGRVFQDTVAICDRVDLIWYGINTRIK